MKTFFSTVGIRVLALAMSFITVMVTAHAYGAFGRGVFSASVSIMTLIATITSFSIGRVIILVIENRKEEPRAFLKAHFVSLLTIFCALNVLAFSLVAVFYFLFPSVYGQLDTNTLLIMLFSIPYFMWGVYSKYIFSSLNQLVTQNLIIFVNRSIYVALLLVLVVLFKVGFYWFLFMFSAMNLIQIIYEMYFIKRYCGISFTLQPSFMRTIFRKGCLIHIDTVGGIIITQANVILLNYFLSPVDVGFYNIAIQLFTLCAIVPSVLHLMINSKIAEQGLLKSWEIQLKYVGLTVLYSVGAVILGYTLAPYVIPYVFGMDFEPSVTLFKYLVPSVIGNSLAIIMNPQWVANGYLKMMSSLTILFGGVGLFVSFYLIPSIGVMGAVIATNFNYGIAFLGNLIFLFYLSSKYRKLA